MRNAIRYVWLIGVVLYSQAYCQVDTTFIYSNNKPYGSLDIRIRKSATSYYYLEEDKTFSFRETSPGVKTNTYLDMTGWDSSPYREGHLREKNGTSDNFVMNYRLLMPEGYDDNYNPGYPIIIIFHGLGERGNCWDNMCYHATPSYSPVVNEPPAPTSSTFQLLNNDHQLSNGGYAHLAARNAAAGKLPDDKSLEPRAFPGFILMPQNLNGWDILSTQDALRLLRLIIKHYNIDEDRVYIHGLSNGGQGVYEAIKRAPWMFAAALTMSAISDANINSQKVAGYIAPIPLWTFQGGQDINPSPNKTQNYIRQFRDAGMSVRFTFYPNLGHGTWTTAYAEPDFFAWILEKNRADIHPFAGTPMICDSDGLELRMPDGFFAYQWERNGSIISGADEATYVATAPGKYRARFSRVPNPGVSDWNQWSAPLEVEAGEPPPKAVIEQTGTVLLKDLNNYPNAQLRSRDTYSHYYWYKNGGLIDFPGSEDDTLREVMIVPTMGDGVYTLATANQGNCIGPQSDPKHIFFNNEAPVNLPAPTDLTAEVDGPSVTLKWKDASSGEGGFEIWRRLKIDASNFAPWEMAVLTSPNATTYEDSGLHPTSAYQYKIRAVSATGRSDYHPSGTGVQLTTGADEEPPTAPTNLLAERIGVRKIRFTWHRSTDNTVLRDYFIHYGNEGFPTQSTDTVVVISNMPLNQKFDVVVTARDIAGNISDPSNVKQVSTYMSGLFYQHSTGFIIDLDSVDWDHPEFTGMVQTFSLDLKKQEDYFSFRFDGYLYITAPGTYQFRIRSDDGSRVRLNNKVIIENDGIHGPITKTSGNQSLQGGPQRITVDYFDYIDDDSLAVEYRGPDTGGDWSSMSVEVLKSDPSIITGVEPPLGVEAVMDLSVYPNPSGPHDIHVQLRSARRGPVLVRLLDPVGRQVVANVFDVDLLSEGVELSAPGVLTEGMYIITATQEGITTRKRLIIKE